MQKIFFFILTLFITTFLLGTTNALVIQDISQQVQQGNDQLIKSNNEIMAQMSQIKNHIIELQQQINDLDSNVMKRQDLPDMYNEVSAIQQAGVRDNTTILLCGLILGFSLVFFSRSQRWI